MDRKVQRKKAKPGTGVDLNKPRSKRKPKRSREMEAALQSTRKESQEFLSGVVSFRLEQEQLDELMELANSIGLSAGQLARSWMVERLRQQKESRHWGQAAAASAAGTSGVSEGLAPYLLSPRGKGKVGQNSVGLRINEFGMVEICENLASKEEAESVIERTCMKLSARGKPAKGEIGMELGDLELLARLAAFALKNAR